MSTLERLKELKAQMDAIVAEMKDASNNVITEGVKELFAKYPKLERFGFTITGPHAMDGDPTDAHVGRDDPDDELGIIYDGTALSRYLDEEDDEGNPIKTHPDIEAAGYDWHSRRKFAWEEADVPEGAQNVLKETTEHWGKARDKWTYDNPDFVEWAGVIAEDIIAFLGVFPTETLRDIYEDNTRITYVRDGDKVRVDSDEYGYW